MLWYLMVLTRIDDVESSNGGDIMGIYIYIICVYHKQECGFAGGWVGQLASHLGYCHSNGGLHPDFTYKIM